MSGGITALALLDTGLPTSQCVVVLAVVVLEVETLVVVVVVVGVVVGMAVVVVVVAVLAVGVVVAALVAKRKRTAPAHGEAVRPHQSAALPMVPLAWTKGLDQHAAMLRQVVRSLRATVKSLLQRLRTLRMCEPRDCGFSSPRSAGSNAEHVASTTTTALRIALFQYLGSPPLTEPHTQHTHAHTHTRAHMRTARGRVAIQRCCVARRGDVSA